MNIDKFDVVCILDRRQNVQTKYLNATFDKDCSMRTVDLSNMDLYNRKFYRMPPIYCTV